MSAAFPSVFPFFCGGSRVGCVSFSFPFFCGGSRVGCVSFSFPAGDTPASTVFPSSVVAAVSAAFPSVLPQATRLPLQFSLSSAVAAVSAAFCLLQFSLSSVAAAVSAAGSQRANGLAVRPYGLSHTRTARRAVATTRNFSKIMLSFPLLAP